MCGICGVINFNNTLVQEAPIRRMMQTMKHRGPDDDGIFLDDAIGLGFVRLSILDLTIAGHQPMQDMSGRYTIIHNGEVYNFIELREELRSKGVSFRSNTDTEVILNAYIHWGEACLDRFNGMWAFAIYDRKMKQLFVSRDRYGIKPFYYFMDGEQFIFASEIPAILKVLPGSPSPNEQAIFDYLVFNRTDQTDFTFFEDVKKLPHGCCLRISLAERNQAPTEEGWDLLSERVIIKRWYNLRAHVKTASAFHSPDSYRSVFSSAVGLRLRSDVPIGVCLSGGLDSSSIVSVLLKDFNKTDVHTFSAVYGQGEIGDESSFIEEFSSQLQNMHFITPSAETLFDDMSSFVQAQGEPVPSTSPYAQFKVMQLARQNVVVTLDGQGADEQLAGYHYFFGFYFKELLRRVALLKMLVEIKGYLVEHRSLYGLKTLAYFLLPEILRTKTRVAEKGYLEPEFVRGHDVENKVAGTIYGSLSLNDALLDHFEYKLEHLLKWEDRNSMWFSLESRVPFLDHRLVEGTIASASQMKIRGGKTKYLLREALKDVLPARIQQRRDKVGFETPAALWFRKKPFVDFIQSLLQDGYFFKNGIMNANNAQAVYDQHRRGAIDASKEIWKWINLELWLRKFIGQK